MIIDWTDNYAYFADVSYSSNDNSYCCIVIPGTIGWKEIVKGDSPLD